MQLLRVSFQRLQKAKLHGFNLFPRQYDRLELFSKTQIKLRILETVCNCPMSDSMGWMHQAIIMLF